MMNPNPGRDKLRQALADFTTEYYKEDVSSEIVPIPELRLPIQNRRLTTRALSRLRLIGRQVASFLLVLLITTIMHAPMQKTVRNISPSFCGRLKTMLSWCSTMSMIVQAPRALRPESLPDIFLRILLRFTMNTPATNT